MILQTSVSTVLVESSSEAVKLNYGSWLVIFDIRVIKKRKEFTSFSCLKTCVLQTLNFLLTFYWRVCKIQRFLFQRFFFNSSETGYKFLQWFFFNFSSQCSHLSDLFSNCPPQKVIQGNWQHAWCRRNSHFKEYYCWDRSKPKIIHTFCPVCLGSVSC